MKQIIFLLLITCLMNSCTVFCRAVRYGSEDIDDYKVFPTYDLNENENEFTFEESNNNLIDTLNIDWNYKNQKFKNIDSLLENTSTRAFLVIKDDSIMYENYFRGYKREDISTVFSVSKSVTSLLVGIAIDEGYISSINDPVTKYIAELRSEDPLFEKLTIKDLLDMRSGLKFSENYGFNPFAKIARLYYGSNQMSVLKNLDFECEPGSKHEYQSVSTAILGWVVESATQQNVAEYFEDKIWKPLGMENSAKWNMDSKKHQSVKAYGGLSISAIDLAKIGRLYLNEGMWNGKQIVSKQWVKESLTPNIENDGYQNQWYSDWAAAPDTLGNTYFDDLTTAEKLWHDFYEGRYEFHECTEVKKEGYKKKYQKKYWKFDSESKWRLKLYTGQFYALGIMQQILYIDPGKNTIIVRLGDSSDFGNYTNLMYKINMQL